VSFGANAAATLNPDDSRIVIYLQAAITLTKSAEACQQRCLQPQLHWFLV
jgi:hypothetical protein